MVMVTFLTPSMPDRLVVEAPAGERLSQLMMRHELSVPCGCEAGRCGLCAVKIVPQRCQAHWFRLGGRERLRLLEDGKLTLQESQSYLLKDLPPRWRLACQYVLEEDPILVVF